MSVRRLAADQPESFEFTKDNLAWANELIAKYPEGKQRSAVIPLLWRAQEQNDGWTSEPAIRKIAEMLDMAYIRVYEVATFYTMFQLSPVGKKAHIQVCGTTPCMLRGARELIKICKRRIASEPHTLSADGDFSWEEVECLGACVNAPMIQIFKDTYEDLDEKSFEILLDAFDRGEAPTTGPQIDRDYSCPEEGLTSLIDVPDYIPLNLRVGASEEEAAAATAAVETALKERPVRERPEAEELKAPVSVTDQARPDALQTPDKGNADDLKMIKGVGPKIEQTLNGLGIFHFFQIASWTAENIAWVDESLSFKGRIEREDWVNQAKVLAEGAETEFSRRASYDKKPGGGA